MEGIGGASNKDNLTSPLGAAAAVLPGAGAGRWNQPRMGTQALSWIGLTGGDTRDQFCGSSRDSEECAVPLRPVEPRKRLLVPVMGSRMKVLELQRTHAGGTRGSTDFTAKRPSKERLLIRGKRQLATARHTLNPKRYGFVDTISDSDSSDQNSPPLRNSRSGPSSRASSVEMLKKTEVLKEAAAGIGRKLADIKGSAAEKFEALVGLVNPSKTPQTQRRGGVWPRKKSGNKP